MQAVGIVWPDDLFSFSVPVPEVERIVYTGRVIGALRDDQAEAISQGMSTSISLAKPNALFATLRQGRLDSALIM